MPPSSRKRNKGKERKAKKLEKVEIERADANKIWQELKNCVECMHGNDTAISNDHPVSKFLDEFFVLWERRQQSFYTTLNDMLQKHPQVWTDKDNRELAIQTFLSIGTNMLLVDDADTDNTSPARDMVKTIIVLEHHDSSEGFTLESSVLDHAALVKKREIDSDVSSTRRDVLKFYRKRLPCKCLKRMHLDARKLIPKMGKCYYCKIEKERVELSVCSRCMISQYCSRECQVEHWRRRNHEKVCTNRY